MSRSRGAVPAESHLNECKLCFSLSVLGQDLVLDVVAFYDRIIPSTSPVQGVCVCECVSARSCCVCVRFTAARLAELRECKQWQWVAGILSGLSPSWREAICPAREHPVALAQPAALASGNSSWLRPDAVVGADNH